MANALPFLLLGGAAIMMMGGKKKAKPKHEEEVDEEFGEEPVAEMTSDIDEVKVATMMVEPTKAQKCNRFINAVWVEPGPGEASIKSLVIEETVLPELMAAAEERRREKGGALSPDFAHSLVMIGLNLIAPDCGWVLTGDGWRYADGQIFEGKVLDVYEGLHQLSLEVIDAANKPKVASLGITPDEPDEPEPGGFQIGEG